MLGLRHHQFAIKTKESKKNRDVPMSARYSQIPVNWTCEVKMTA